MTDQSKPDRQDGDGLLREREAIIRECIVVAGTCDAGGLTPGEMRSAIIDGLRNLVAVPVQPGVGEREAEPNSLLLNIRSYAKDLGRNQSGSDDFPWEFLRSVAKELDRLCDDYLASSSLTVVQITDAMLDAHMMATGDWVDPFVWKHDPDLEDANQVPEGLTQEGANRINSATREQLRRGYIAALSRQAPQSSREG